MTVLSPPPSRVILSPVSESDDRELLVKSSYEVSRCHQSMLSGGPAVCLSIKDDEEQRLVTGSCTKLLTQRW